MLERRENLSRRKKAYIIHWQVTYINYDSVQVNAYILFFDSNEKSLEQLE
jgi:hypothetical protein